MPRLFLAVRVPPLPRLEQVLDRFRGLDGVKPVAPENLHYTIRFLGDVAQETDARLRDVLDGATIDERPFEIAIEGTSAFPSAKKPRVVWAGSDDEGGTRLTRVAEGVDRFADEVGLGARDKPFVPHLTLARVKKPGGRGGHEASRIVHDETETEYGSVTVDKVALVESTLTSKGPVYEDVLEVPLE